MVIRRQVLLAALGALSFRNAAAQKRPVRIGVLGPVALQRSVWAGPLVRHLGELGYRDSAGAVLEYRAADGIPDNYSRQARELIDLKCDLIFAVGPELPARALREAGARMPVVFLAVDFDPLESGLVKSLSRPEGNITGVYLPQSAMVAKRVEILREVLPRARRFLVLADQFSRGQVSAAQRAADAARVQLSVVEFSSVPYDFSAALEGGRKNGVDGLITLASPVFAGNEARIAALLTKHRLPAIGSTLRLSEPGYLLGFTADVGKVTRRTAEIGVRILKGAKAAEIPVEQADEFELTVNAKTARALGVKIPESVLARATRIIQ